MTITIHSLTITESEFQETVRSQNSEASKYCFTYIGPRTKFSGQLPHIQFVKNVITDMENRNCNLRSLRLLLIQVLGRLNALKEGQRNTTTNDRFIINGLLAQRKQTMHASLIPFFVVQLLHFRYASGLHFYKLARTFPAELPVTCSGIT